MSLPGTRYWPRHAPPPEEERVAVRCEQCGLFWWIHRDMAGYRLRCDCGAWLQVPPVEEAPLRLEDRPGEGALQVAPVRQELAFDRRRGTIRVPAGSRANLAEQQVPTNLPVEAGALQEAGLETRRRWTNRGLLELAAMMASFLVPYLAILLFATGRERALLMPLAGLAGGILVLLVGMTSAWYTFGLVRGARPALFGEAILAAAGTACLALGYVSLLEGAPSTEPLRQVLGLELALFVVGFCPALFEELAFRGLLQGRFSALLGKGQGVLVAGTAFALAHGVTLGFPFHLGIGLYLCWLRNRAESLVPGMVFHFLYNSIIVVFV